MEINNIFGSYFLKLFSNMTFENTENTIFVLFENVFVICELNVFSCFLVF